MRVTSQIALGILVAIWALLVCAVQGYRFAQSRPVQATLGISIALLVASALGMAIWLIFLAIKATPEDPRKAASYSFRWMLAAVAIFSRWRGCLYIRGLESTIGGWNEYLVSASADSYFGRARPFNRPLLPLPVAADSCAARAFG